MPEVLSIASLLFRFSLLLLSGPALLVVENLVCPSLCSVFIIGTCDHLAVVSVAHGTVYLSNKIARSQENLGSSVIPYPYMPTDFEFYGLGTWIAFMWMVSIHIPKSLYDRK
jgi:hypothetical protein